MVKSRANIFVTFGAGRSGWLAAARRLTKEAEKTNLFEFNFNLDENWLRTWDEEAYSIGENLRDELPPRGFGYWTWKPTVLLWAHLNFPHHQIVYIDAGSEFKKIHNDYALMSKYLNESYENGGLAWRLPHHVEKNWTKREVFDLLMTPNSHRQSNQIQSGFIALPPSNIRDQFVRDWRRLAIYKQGFLFTDITVLEDQKELIEHRHDQSAFSCLWKRYNLPSEQDMTDKEGAKKLYFQASRNNSYLPTEDSYIRRVSRKYLYLVVDKLRNLD